jgi:hypothetical protein
MPDRNPDDPPSIPPTPPAQPVQPEGWSSGFNLLKSVGLEPLKKVGQRTWEKVTVSLPGYHEHMIKGYEARELSVRSRIEGDPGSTWDLVPPTLRSTDDRARPSRLTAVVSPANPLTRTT